MNPVRSLRRLTSRDKLPKSRILRMILGILLVFLGLLGFLPVLGFWMIPLGLGVLAVDIPIARRWLHRMEDAYERWQANRRKQ